ncbi:MAG: hypothetical protein SOX71_05995, partial [Candidatus Faecousia sp.]|nr:hypothetical protein [Candidatus Faecousia sp.]
SRVDDVEHLILTGDLSHVDCTSFWTFGPRSRREQGLSAFADHSILPYLFQIVKVYLRNKEKTLEKGISAGVS